MLLALLLLLACTRVFKRLCHQPSQPPQLSIMQSRSVELGCKGHYVCGCYLSICSTSLASISNFNCILLVGKTKFQLNHCTFRQLDHAKKLITIAHVLAFACTGRPHSTRSQEDTRLLAGCGTHADCPREIFTIPLVCTVYAYNYVELTLDICSLPSMSRTMTTTMTEINNKKAMLPRTPPTIAAVLSGTIGEIKPG